MTTEPPKPRDIDIRSGLIEIPTIHIVAQSVARSIVELLQKDNEWRAFILEELAEQEFCHESRALVATMLVRLCEAELLAVDGNTYTVTHTFLEWCAKQQLKAPA